MKIDKEKFDKLKQLDRIEYRQKLNEIKERYDYSISFNFVLFIFISAFLLVLIGLNFYEISLFNIDGELNEGIDDGYEMMESLFNIALIILQLGMIYILIEIIITFTFLLFKYKKIKELNEEYFSMEIKK